ncbi:MAG: NAD-dependent epimerase/dehydratase family protein [Blautia sp.]
MEIMLVGGLSPMVRKLSLKLYKEGHRIYVLSGSRNPANHYEHIFERYDFPYDSASIEEVFQSVNPDVTILMGAFDGNLSGEDPKREAIQYAAGLQNILLSWSALEKGRLIYLSSAEVYGSSYQIPVTESIRPVPRGIRPLMLFQGEESCRFYQEQLKKDVLILRLDRLHDVPKDKREAAFGICQRKCLDAFRTGAVSYRTNYKYGLTYMGDAVESIYKLVACEEHQYGLYHISSSEAYSELQIVDAIGKYLGKESGQELEKINNTLEDQNSVILSNERIKEEFGFKIWCEPEETIQKTLAYMKKHIGRFLESSDSGWDIWHRIYFKIMELFGALVPYLENLIFFIPFFMLNNRATGSQYFSKIDFYLIYVLLFAVVHGQRQATVSALLATAGYLFRQMYHQSGIAVVTDYNTYVWIVEIFIVGLVVGYMKDQLKFLEEEKEQEVDFLSERVTDIGDINDSNLRVKEGLITQVVNYDYSLGTVYDMVEQLEEDYPAKILFHAITLIRDVMNCQDVSLYRINEEKYARLFGYTSTKAGSMGHTVHLPDKEPLYETFSRQEVYLNRNMDPAYPMMAYCIYEEEKMEMMIQLWSIPFERMTIDESNRLIIISKLIQKSVHRSAHYLDVLRNERYQDDSQALRADAFEELVSTYREVGEKNLTEYILLQVVSEQSDMESAGHIISKTLRATDYIGYRNDGNLYILLTSTDKKGCGFVQKNLEQKGIHTVIREEMGL